MASSVSPLPAHAVTLILSYTASLQAPLPQHLISTPLRQRHHFLRLVDSLSSEEDIATYLSWPSPTNPDAHNSVVQLLSFLPPPEHVDPLTVYSTKYTFDGEAAYAHAFVPLLDLSSVQHRIEESPNGTSTHGLRFIFRWEAEPDDGAFIGHGGNADGWKYHDVQPMPFPQEAYDSPQLAVDPSLRSVSATAATTANASSYTANGSVLDVYEEHETASSDSDGDAYWNSYGRSSSDDEEDEYFNPNQTVPSATNLTDDEKAEDAYWAQYASVQGTADSTRPSPRPRHRKLHNSSQPLPPHSASNPSNLSRSDSWADSDFSFAHLQNHRDMQIEDLRDIHALANLAALSSDPHMFDSETLARRLHALSPRSPLSPRTVVPSDVAHHQEYAEPFESPPTTSDGSHSHSNSFESGSGTGSGSGSDTQTPPTETEIHSPRPRRSHEHIFFDDVNGGEDKHGSSATATEPKPKFNGESDEIEEVDEALRSTIKGIYSLWSTSRKVHSSTGMTSKQDFMKSIERIVDTL